MLDEVPSYYGYVYAPCVALCLDYFFNGVVYEFDFYYLISPAIALGYAFMNYFVATPELCTQFPIDEYEIVLLATLQLSCDLLFVGFSKLKKFP